MTEYHFMDLADIDDVVQLCSEAFHEGDHQCEGLPFCPVQTRTFLGSVWAAPTATGILARRGGKLIGVILASLESHFFSPAVIAQERLLYVAPEHRGGLVAFSLVAAYVSWARRSGAVRARAGVTSGAHRVQRVARLYEGHGFSTIGAAFELNLEVN